MHANVLESRGPPRTIRRLLRRSCAQPRRQTVTYQPVARFTVRRSAPVQRSIVWVLYGFGEKGPECTCQVPRVNSHWCLVSHKRLWRKIPVCSRPCAPFRIQAPPRERAKCPKRIYGTQHNQNNTPSRPELCAVANASCKKRRLPTLRCELNGVSVGL